VVLLVDDEPQMRGLVGMVLEGTGASVVQASGLDQALDEAQRARPSLVLLDIGLGPEDGLELLPKLRAQPALSGVPILVFSVHDSRREEALGQGADGFVAKPFSPTVLRQAVAEHLS
jgi:two-component system chemotaxis response regulator CheY